MRQFFLNKRSVLIILAGIFCLQGIWAQHLVDSLPVPLFRSDEILYLDLQADFKEVFSNTDDSTNFPAILTLTDNSGDKKTVEIMIRTRGKTRRAKDVCRFPPLRLNFPKKEMNNTPFEDQNAIKLVTHCDKSNDNEQNTIIEYLIYKAYNVLTDSSFKVRPAFINYIYEGKKNDTVRKFAFFLEKEKHLAERLHGIEIEGEKIHPNRTDSYQTCLMDIFQYMVGNTDYSMFELHNVILLSDSTRLHPPAAVPYDFDWSGMINAEYAVPHPLIETETVTERVYRGFKKEPEIVYRAIKTFIAKKEDIYRVFQDSELLDKLKKKQINNYLDEFYQIINNNYLVQKEFFDKARVVHD